MQKIKEEILSLEKQEQDPAVYSSPIKAKQIGRTKRQAQDLLDLIEETSSLVFYFDELLIGFSDEELILDEILSTDTDSLPPIEALLRIARWKKALTGK